MKQHLLTRPRTSVWLTALAMGLGSAGSLTVATMGTALAAPVVKKGGPSVTLNFVNAEIEGVARAMAAIVDRQIMVDPRVKGAITLYSEQPLSPREAYLNFLAALRGQGFAMVEVSGLLKIVPEAEAKLQTGVVDVGAVRRSGDQVLTQIFKLQHESSNNLVTVLRPLISPNNTINANPSTNTLVITDYADNLQRIGQIIAAMDVPSVGDTEAIPLQHAIAADIAPMVQRLADGGGAAAPGGAAAQATLVMADSRTNTLLVRSPSAARAALVRNLVRQMDRPGSAGIGGSGIHVVYLRNADAVKLAQVLRAAFPGGGGSAGGGASSGTSATPTSTNPAAGGANSAAAGNSGSSSQTSAPVAASAQPSTGGFIQADPATNSLIITATDGLYRQLRAVIDQLDGRRAQIYIEAMIVKVDANKAAQIGVQWAAASGDRNIVGAATNLPQGSSSTLTSGIPGLASTVASGANALNSLQGFSVGLARRLSDGTYSMGALANFLKAEAGGNVLSTPNLVTLDNEEAKIVVGENVPFVTGSFTNTGSGSGATNPFQTIERKDVGLTLRVRPQVGDGGTVRMTIFQEDARVNPATAAAANGPTTSKSSIETTVVVDDGQVLVLGGLMKDEYGDGESKVPLLGDLPVLGNLFKSQQRSRVKSNLMVFLRPVVMRDQDAANSLTMDRYDFMRQRQMDSTPQAHSVLGINEVPVMNPLQVVNGVTMPSVRQPLDQPGMTPPTVVMPVESGYVPRVQPVSPPASAPSTGSAP